MTEVSTVSEIASKNPALIRRNDNIITAAVNEIFHGLFDSIVIFLADKMDQKDIMTAVALKHFFLENNISVQILSNSDHMKKRSVDSVLISEIDENINPGRFIAISIGAKNEYQIVGEEYKKTYLLFNVAAGKGVNKFAVKNLIDPFSQCPVELLFPQLLEAAEKSESLLISKRVLTDLYLAMLYATAGYERKVCESSLDTMKALISAGADYKEAYSRYDAVPVESLECTRILTGSLRISKGIASAVIRLDDMPENFSRESWEKAVRAFRNLDSADLWVVNVEENPGSFFTVLQAKSGNGYDVSKVAKKYNGNGNEKLSRCIVYEMDLMKILKDIEELQSKS